MATVTPPRAQDSQPRRPEVEPAVAGLTVGLGGPRPDLGPLRDYLAWRDAQNSGLSS